MSAETSRGRNERCEIPTQFDISMKPDAGPPVEAHRPVVRDGEEECAVVVADSDGTVRYVSTNFELLCGYSRYEILGKNVRDLRSGRRDGPFFGAVQDALRSGKAGTGTFSTVREDGEPRMESATICPVTDETGVVNRCVGVRRDVSGRGLREEADRKSRAMEAVARLAGGVAHNFNNILTAILGYSDLLFPRVACDAAAMRSLREIREAGERAAVLTRQLLAFSREQALMPKVFHLNALVGAVVRELRGQREDGIDIRTCLGEDLGRVSADPDKIRQAIVALAVNARDAMPNGGRLTFVTGNVRFDAPFVRDAVRVSPGDYVMLTVSDTGPGMDEDVRSRIFEPFQTTKADASGLGLAAVYGIVKQSGGYIWVSGPPGKGTAFEILLPRAARLADAAAVGREGKAPRPGANRLPGDARHMRGTETHAAPIVLAGAPEGL